MEKEPKSVWRRPWKGRRAFVFWILIVPIAAFLGACLVASITSISVPLFGIRPGIGGYFKCVVIITFWLIIGLAALLGVCNFIFWIFLWRNFKRLLFVSACFATLIALFYAEEDWRGKHDWEQFKRQWEAKGENFDRNSVVPQPVPDAKNFAMSPVWIAEIKRIFGTKPERAEAWYGDRIYSTEVSNYFRLLPFSDSAVIGTNDSWNLPKTPDSLGNWAVARMSDLRPWQSFYRNLEHTNPSADIAINSKPQTPAQDVLLALSKFDPIIERLRQDSELPYSRFPIEYNKDQEPGNILVPNLRAVKRSAQVLELRAIAELQNGQTDKALADVNLMFRLADIDRVEPFLISHLVRIAVLQITLQPIYEGLANHQWSDSQLTELDSKLANFDFLNDYKFSMRGEMILFQNGLIDFARRHPGQILNVLSDTTSTPSPLAAIAEVIPEGWFYQNELHADRSMEEFLLPLADTNQAIISPASVRRADDAVAAETRHRRPFNLVERLTDIVLSPAMTFAYGQNAVNLARVAISLERYRFAHGQYPDSLDVLAPQIIVRLPHDIINGQPLHYQRIANGRFILYSVGWDETDDGGAVVMKEGSTPTVDRKKGDWVWRYPDK